MPIAHKEESGQGGNKEKGRKRGERETWGRRGYFCKDPGEGNKHCHHSWENWWGFRKWIWVSEYHLTLLKDKLKKVGVLQMSKDLRLSKDLRAAFEYLQDIQMKDKSYLSLNYTTRRELTRE